MLAEQKDEWAVCRRYMAPESLARAHLRVIDGSLDEATQHELSDVNSLASAYYSGNHNDMYRLAIAGYGGFSLIFEP